MTLPKRLNRTLKKDDLITLEWACDKCGHVSEPTMLEVKHTGRTRTEVLFVAPEEVRIECVSLRTNEKDAPTYG